MRQSDLVALMGEQSAYRVGLIAHEVVSTGEHAIVDAFKAAVTAGQRYVVVDAFQDDHLRALGGAVRNHRLLTGGSALAMGLPANFGISARQAGTYAASSVAPVKTAILSGSCSAATRQQLARAKELWPSYKIDLDALAEGKPVVDEALAWARQLPNEQPIVVYGSADPSEVEANQKRYGRQQAGEMMEQALASIAEKLVAEGVGRLLVAGGETSGAVISALKIKGLSIGAEIAPGVPWTITLSKTPLQVALKSGNFGGPDFFKHALEIAP